MRNIKYKTPNVFYNPIEGSAPLSITWYGGPKGDAVEANNEIGVGFFGSQGELLMAMFDNVTEFKDHQVLEFDRYRVEVSVKKGKAYFELQEKSNPKRVEDG